MKDWLLDSSSFSRRPPSALHLLHNLPPTLQRLTARRNALRQNRMSSSSLGSSNNLPTASAGGTPPSPAASQSRSASQPSSSAPPSSPTASSTPIFDRLRSLISHRSPSLSSSSSTTTAHRHSASESGGSSLSVDRGAQVESGSSRLEDLSLHERGDEVIGDVQREGQQSREAEASSSDGGDLVKTSEQRGEGE